MSERGWPAIDAVRDEIAAAEKRHDRRLHLTVLRKQHVALVADQIRYELAADRAKRGKPLRSASLSSSSPRPDEIKQVVTDPGGADDYFLEHGYRRRERVG